MKINKTSAVLQHLFEHKHITSIEAIDEYRATRLAAIIFNLRKAGYQIETEMCRTEDGTPYGRYWLLSDQIMMTEDAR